MPNSPKKKFIKVKENFICEHCGLKVKGTGYTNHCPNCLWSKHVDLEIPGDRLNPCQGLMEPVGAEQKKGKWRIITKCLQCGKVHVNEVSPEDNKEEIIKLSAKPISSPKNKA